MPTVIRPEPSARLVIKGFWGYPAPNPPYPSTGARYLPGVSINVLAADQWKAARKRNAVSGLKKLRGIDYNAAGAELQRRGRSQKDVAAICLDYTNEWPNELNGMPATFTSGLTPARTPFDVGDGLAFQDRTVGLVCEFPGPEIDENAAHSIRFYFHKPPTDEMRARGLIPTFSYRWGMNTDGVKGFWQFQILNNQASLMRLTPAWTQAKEDQLHTLLTIDDKTNEETDRIAALYKELYDNVESIQVGYHGLDNQRIELTFLPERRGVITVDETERDANAVEVPDVIKERAPSVVWPKAVSRIRSTMGFFWMQFGKPMHKTKGDIRLGTYIHPADLLYGDAKVKMLTDEPDGTAVEVVQESGDPSDPNYNPILKGSAETGYERETVIRLSGDGTRTPFLYGAHLYFEAGQRSGSDTTIWDSSDHPRCIKEIDPQLEGSSTGPVSRKSQYRVTLRAYAAPTWVEELNQWKYLDSAFGPNDNLRNAHFRFENRVCDLYINGGQRVGSGIITGVNFTNARSAEGIGPDKALLGQNALWEWTDIELDICDKWFLMDEDVFTGDEPVCDGGTMGDHLRSCLLGAGERTTEINFTDNDGPLLDSASIGEKFAIQPDSYEARGPYMVEFIRKNDTARNQIGVDNNGIWQLGPYDTTPRIGRDGSPVNFVSGDRNDPYTYPGRYQILKKHEMTRDFSKVYNWFVAIGAEDEYDQRIIRPRQNWNSIKARGDTPRFNALGRRRVMRPIRDSGWRTPAQVERAVRRVEIETGLSGWFLVFETYFHDDFYPGDRFYSEGWASELIRVPQGSWANDRMTFAVLIFD